MPQLYILLFLSAGVVIVVSSIGVLMTVGSIQRAFNSWEKKIKGK